jgi:7-carboxy-7-deazaguanine synthase
MTTLVAPTEFYVTTSIFQGSPVLPVSEIYGPVRQGEGLEIGLGILFVRFGGCDYLCKWCDSLYAVDKKIYGGTWMKMTAQDILEQLKKLATPPIRVVLSGGNPAIHNLAGLIDKGHQIGFTFAIETQGTILPEWASDLDTIVLSPKPPSSGMVTDWFKLRAWLDVARGTVSVENVCLKVVIFDDADLLYAAKVRDIAADYNVPFFLQSGTSKPYTDTSTPDLLADFRLNIIEHLMWLNDRVTELGWHEARVLPQLHAVCYGAKRGI